MLIIGESLNATRKEICTAVSTRNIEFVQSLAREQVVAGANVLDVNAAVPGEDEVANLVWMVKVVQEAVEVPLVIDSSCAEAIAAAVGVHQGRPMINSISGETDRINKLLPIALQNECDVIVLCMDDAGIPRTVEGRMKSARKVIEPLLNNGKRSDEIFVDPLVGAAATDPDAPKVTLQTIQMIKEEFPGIQTVAGVSNVSFGMPSRKLLNRVFLSLCICKGLDSCIVDARDQALTSVIWATTGLIGDDKFRPYLKTYRKGALVG